MNITFACPQCEQPGRVQLGEAERAITCPNCRQNIEIPEDALEQDCVRRCLVCPSTNLFLRKDFPQQVGVAIVAVGFVASSVAWWYYHAWLTYAILLATVLIDLLLYLFVGDALMCYRCGAQYRQVAGLDDHAPFNLETHERHRQETERLKQHTRTSRDEAGKADAQKSEI